MASKADQAVLNAILNPFTPTETFDNTTIDDLKDDVSVTEEVRKAKKLEHEAVALAEAGQLTAALEVINKAAFTHPGLPSIFNNRAQIHRLLKNDDRALEDLDEAIIISCGRGKSGCLALCQRGLIHRKNGREEAAVADLMRAAQLGSTFARMQLVELNPYAALCNKMLGQVFHKLRN